jgi:hypothetical protein
VRIPKLLAVPALALAMTAGTLVSVATPASAATVTAGTTTVSVQLSFVVNAAQAGIIAIPLKPATSQFNSTTNNVDIAFPVTGGDGNVATLTGFVQHSGALLLVNVHNGKSVKLTSMAFDVSNTVFTFTPGGGAPAVALFEIGGVTSSQTGTTNTYTATSLGIHPDGASYLDSTLGTSYFTPDQLVGGIASTWTLS